MPDEPRPPEIDRDPEGLAETTYYGMKASPEGESFPEPALRECLECGVSYGLRPEHTEEGCALRRIARELEALVAQQAAESIENKTHRDHQRELADESFELLLKFVSTFHESLRK